MFGDAPYRASWNWYTLYWLIFCGVLAILTVMFWPRGKQDRWAGRRRNAALAFSRWMDFGDILCLVAFACTGGWIWYNTVVINRVVGPKTLQRRQADYEKAYKQYEKKPQPRVRSVKYAIDVYPESRNIDDAGRTGDPESISAAAHRNSLTVDPNYVTEIDIPGSIAEQRR